MRGAGAAAPPPPETVTVEEALALVEEAIEKGASRKDAAKDVAKATGFSKNILYSQSVK